LGNKGSAYSRSQIEEGILHKRSPALLDSILFQGQIKRGEVEGILQVAPRTARRVVSDLLGAGILSSDGVKSPLRIAFPAKLASEIMPGLFPEV
jgi:Fic family protein